MVDRAHVASLTDIVDAITIVREEIERISMDVLETDRRKRWLVEQGIEIISEASRRLPVALKERHPEIPWPKVAGIGNILRHEYQRVAHDLLWHVVAEDLPGARRLAARSYRGPEPGF
ncbi:MAG TPA: HepT-like ribonuclease domain-containing protein [Candidatus Binataceae bacterium]|nr:HepT-like ribonuclease domain-containing protein [Candidatus Binataceae bacterium]